MRVRAAAELVQSLVDHGDFGHATTSIEIVETHISWVLLTGEYAYKIKKPVDLGFLDFSTLDARHHYCLLELDLNRRFTPEVYLDVVSIGGRPDRPVIGATPALEWAVLMRQFPVDARLDRQIAAGCISPDDMRTFGESMARLHERSPTLPPDDDPSAPVTAISGPVEDNLTVLRMHCTQAAVHDRIEGLADWCKRELARLTPTIRNRRTNGFVRECHGDLHLENLVRLDDQITPFDCIEFDAALRCIDVINEVAFLLMDTLRIGRPDLGFSFLNRYLEVSGDYPGIALLPYFCVYRCLVRAKIAVLRRPQDDEVGTDADVIRYIELAEHLVGLHHADHSPCLVICRGLSGSGKTYVSQQLLSIMPAIRIRSDIVRKKEFRIGELESTGSVVAGGLYSKNISAQIYGALARFASVALTAGYHVIVDATFLRQTDRKLLHSVAKRCQARFAILDCTADESILVRRIESRLTKGRDASEADLAVLDWQQENIEPLSDDEQHYALAVDTGCNWTADEIAHRLQEQAQ